MGENLKLELTPEETEALDRLGTALLAPALVGSQRVRVRTALTYLARMAAESLPEMMNLLKEAADTLASEAELYRDGPGSKGLQPHGHSLHKLASRLRAARKP